MKKNNQQTYLLGILFVLIAVSLPLTVTLVDKRYPRTQNIKTSAQELEKTFFTLTIAMPGVGNSGDSTNPNNNNLSTKSPTNPDKQVTVSVYSTAGTHLLSKTGIVSYDNTIGAFTGTIDMGTELKTDNYIIFVKPDGYLRKLVGTHQVTELTNVNLPATTVIAGDLNNDNHTNIIDFNILMGCYSDLFPAKFCNETSKEMSDFSRDGRINVRDYNLFLREIHAQKGD